MTQGAYDTRNNFQSLDLAWTLLRIFPRELLHRIPAKTLDQYYSRDATHWLLIRVPMFWQVQLWINWTDWPCGLFAVFIYSQVQFFSVGERKLFVDDLVTATFVILCYVSLYHTLELFVSPARTVSKGILGQDVRTHWLYLHLWMNKGGEINFSKTHAA